MTERRRSPHVLIAALLAAAAVCGCRGTRRPAPPKGADPPATNAASATKTAPAVASDASAASGAAIEHPIDVAALIRGSPRELKPYLDAYPLGESGTRIDLLARDANRSLHLVQTRSPIGRHYHPQRTETAYVLRGTGTVYIGDKSYPANPGATFRIAKGVAHSVLPDEGSTLIALCWFDPPLVEGDDRVRVE